MTVTWSGVLLILTRLGCDLWNDFIELLLSTFLWRCCYCWGWYHYPINVYIFVIDWADVRLTVIYKHHDTSTTTTRGRGRGRGGGRAIVNCNNQLWCNLDHGYLIMDSRNQTILFMNPRLTTNRKGLVFYYTCQWSF